VLVQTDPREGAEQGGGKSVALNGATEVLRDGALLTKQNKQREVGKIPKTRGKSGKTIRSNSTWAEKKQGTISNRRPWKVVREIWW